MCEEMQAMKTPERRRLCDLLFCGSAGTIAAVKEKILRRNPGVMMDFMIYIQIRAIE